MKGAILLAHFATASWSSFIKDSRSALTSACLGVLNTFNVFIFRENDKYAAFSKHNSGIFAFYKQQL
jgi:hypothetical protein